MRCSQVCQTSDYAHPEILFTMGIPGAGKSTWIAHHSSRYSVISADRIKQHHPAYNPKRPDMVHSWSCDIADILYYRIVQGARGKWIVDGTGSNLQRLLRRIHVATCAGFKIGLVYVYCPPEIAVVRNAQRQRILPEPIIWTAAEKISNHFPQVATVVDYVIEIDSTSDDYTLR